MPEAISRNNRVVVDNACADRRLTKTMDKRQNARKINRRNSTRRIVKLEDEDDGKVNKNELDD